MIDWRDESKYSFLRNRYIKVALLGLLFMAGAFLGLAGSAHAAALTVTTTADSVDKTPGDGVCADSIGQCSVRAALMEANAGVGEDVISIPPGIYTLTLGQQLEIKNPVKLVGNGNDPAGTIIQAAGSAAAATHRVLEINPGLDVTGYDVTIEGLTIRHGKAPNVSGYGGGGIGGDVGVKTLTINHSIIEKNIASGEGFGGGLFMSGAAEGKVLLRDVVFNGNEAGESILASYGSRGGGIYLEGDMSLEMSNLTVQNNISYGLGGGIAIVSASPSLRAVTISSSTITGNRAKSKSGGPEGRAGGLYLGTPAMIKDTTLSSNIADGDGGGLVLDFFAGSVSLTTVTISSNTAARGGGMFINANKAPSLTDTSITGNTGGDVAVNPDGTDMKVTIAPNGTFSQGKTGAHYSVTVRNNGQVKTNGMVSATVVLPTGLTAASMAGTGWTCVMGTLTCSRSDVLNGQSNYPVIDVVVNVAGDAARTVRSTAEVSGGDELDVSNNTASHDTTVFSRDATLKGLSASNAVIKETFDSAVLAYTADVLYAISTISITPAVNESHATVKVKGSPVSNGQSSDQNLGVGVNVIDVTVTAEDGTTTKTYTLTVNRANKSTNASLSDLKVDGTSVAGFAPGTLTYTVNVPNAKTAVVVTGTQADATASVTVTGGSNLVVGNNTVTVTVTAEDGTTKKAYTVTVVRAAKNSNASLSDLQVDGTSVAGFAPGTLTYTVNVPNAKTVVVVTGTKADAAASVTVAGGSNLIVGNNTVTVTVTAEDGTTLQTYTVTVVRAGSSNASLSDLQVDGASVAGFAPGTLTYTVNVLNATTAVVVTGTKADATASVTVTGGSNLVVGNNTVTVTVTAEDGATTKVYMVTVVRAAKSINASLSDLQVDGASVAGFAPGTLAYTVNVPNSKTAVVVTGTKADATASVTVTGGSNLVVGDNTVTVTVTAEDGATQTVYTLTVVRAGSSNASLSDLKVDGASVAGFAPGTLTYTVNVPNATTAVVVTGTKADASASVTVAGGSSLVVGSNTVTVTVTAEDGTTTKVYTVTVVRAAKSTNASLSDLQVDGTSVAGFASGTLAYAVNVPNAKTAVVVVGTKADATASVTVTGGSNLVVGSNTVTVKVTAEDGTTVQTYTVTVVRAGSSNASLSDLKVDGASVAGFAPGTLTYTVNVPNAKTAVVVTATRADAAASVTVAGGSSLVVGSNTVTVTVTAEDGTTQTVYTLTVKRANKSTNASLSDLQVDGVSVAGFAPGTLTYTINVSNSKTAVVVTGTKADATANITVTGGSNLVVGNNTVTVTVTAEDGTTKKTYIVTVARAKSSNASLSDLQMDGTSVVGFAPGTYAYTMNVPHAKNAVVVTGTRADATASLTVTGGSNLNVGSNTVTVTVTAEDGTTKTVYTLTVNRANKSTNASLSDLKVDGTSVAGFAPGTYTYTVNVPNTKTSVAVTGTKADATASVTVTGGSNLIVGSNTVTVTVMAEDGTTVQTYTVTVVRAGSGNASLSDLQIDGSSVPGFVPGTYTYTVNVPNATTAVVVTGTKADAKANVSVAGGSNLVVGNNTVTITVMAEDGMTVQMYTVTVIRAGSPDKSFTLTLTVGGISENIQWDKTNTASVSVTNAVYHATVTGSVYDPASQLAINGINVASGQNTTIPLKEGLNSILVKITAQDLSVQDYILHITRYGNAELKGLALSGMDLTPPFNLGLLSYKANVPYTVSSTTVTAAVYDPNAKVTINGLEVKTGDSSAPIQLAVGENIIPIVVTPTFGMPQQYTITITRAASNETGLSGVIVNNGEAAVTLGADGKYYATVSDSITTLIVKPQPADHGARVQVNGLPVDHEGISDRISLAYGINEITISVTSPSGTVQTYTLLVTRQQPSKPNEGGGGGAPLPPVVQVKLNVGDNGKSIQLQVQRERTPDGKARDKVIIGQDAAKLAIEEATRSKQGTAKLAFPQVPQDNDEFNVTIPANTLQALGERSLALSIETGEVQITLPDTTVAKAVQSKEDLYVRFVPIRKDAEKQEAKKRVLTAQIITKAAGNGKAVLHGWPMTIETNLKNQETRLSFSLKGIQIPFDPKEREEFLSSLGIYIEHSDGEKELLRGTIKYDQQKNPIGIEIVISKFSTFSLIEVQKAPMDTVIYKKWIDGYPDGTFRPYQAITRAEAASILAKAAALPKPLNGLQKFNDVPDSHWAANVINQVQGAGWLNGYPDGSFKPDAPITRAELAAILVRLNKLELADRAPSFTDTQGHWAASYIQAAKAAGLVDGYEDGSFRPDQPLTRAEAVKVINTLLKRPTPEFDNNVWTDVSKQDWFWLEVQSASISFSNTRNEDGSDRAVIIP